MPEVSLKIGPKTYNVRCGEGEQEKIAAFGALIAEKYAQLGTARAPLEAQNLLFASLFMADELSEARVLTSEAGAKLEKALAELEHEKSRTGGLKAELQAEIETLRKSEARAREQIAELKAEILTLREAAQHQHDLFGAEQSDAKEEKIALTLEALAQKAEAVAMAMESAIKSPPLEQTGDKA